jgi:hypothetical protein
VYVFLFIDLFGGSWLIDQACDATITVRILPTQEEVGPDGSQQAERFLV